MNSIHGSRVSWVGCALGVVLVSSCIVTEADTPACGDDTMPCMDTVSTCVDRDTAFTIAVLPDTQGYSQFYPEIFAAQTEWLAAQKADMNLQMAVHVGDLVEGSWLPDQWEVARNAMGELDGQVPYIIAPGNHDYGELYEHRNARTRSTRFHHYFPRSLFELMPTFGGFFPEGERSDNSFQTFVYQGQPWIVIALEFGPRDAVLEWADQVLRDHDDHLAIIATHAYLYSDGSRYDWETHGTAQPWSPHSYGVAETPAGVNDGQGMWDAVIAKHAHVVAVLCGHVLNDGLGYAVSHGAGEVHEILANYQMHDLAGGGFLRLMHFDTATSDVHVRTYSPWLDEHKSDPDNEFCFNYAAHVAL